MHQQFTPGSPTWDTRPRRAKRLLLILVVVITVLQVVGGIGSLFSINKDRAGFERPHSLSELTLNVPAQFVIALAAAGALSLLFVRRNPLVTVIAAPTATFLAWLGAGQIIPPILAAPIAAIFLLVARGQRNYAWILLAIGWIPLTVTAIVFDLSPKDGSPWYSRVIETLTSASTWAQLVAPALWCLVAVLAGIGVAARKERFTRLREMAEHERQQEVARAEAEQARRRHVADEERMRVARDLHDTVGHALSVINVQAGVALHVLPDQPDVAGPALTTIKEVSKDALSEVRTVLNMLRTNADTAPKTPDPTLTEVFDVFLRVRSAGLEIEDRIDPALLSGPGEVAPAIGATIYRVVQESLTNVLRHANADTVTVTVKREGFDLSSISVAVVDNGVSFEPVTAELHGSGLVGMRERVRALDGTFDARPTPSGGFAVRAAIPATPNSPNTRNAPKEMDQ